MRFDEPDGGGPLYTALGSAEALLKMCVESSQHIVAMLEKLRAHNLLGKFLERERRVTDHLPRKLLAVRPRSRHDSEHGSSLGADPGSRTAHHTIPLA
jgi:hypothetical protein